MAIQSHYLLCVSMDVEPEYEDLFNEVYDTEHIPQLLKVPGVHAVSRVKGEAFNFAMGGQVKPVDAPTPRYVAMYELDNPEIVASDEWAKAVELGRWPGEVRPHTHTRSHAMYKVLK